MNYRKRSQQQLDQFMAGVANIAIFGKTILPILPIDTTAINSLHCIHRSTRNGKSDEQRKLHFSSGKILGKMQTIRRQFQQIDEKLITINKRQVQKAQQKKKRKKQHESYWRQEASYEIGLQSVVRQLQNENVNMSNFQSRVYQRAKHKDQQSKKNQSSQDLKEIIRPQYRRKQEKNNYQQSTFNFTIPYKNDTNNIKLSFKQFLSSSDENLDDIPLVNHQKRQHNRGFSSSRSDRSISPKVENRRKLISPINFATQQIQIASDPSFETDLNCLGIFSKTGKKAIPRHEQNRDKGGEKPIIMPQRTDNDEIEEEQPWQCDEDELQQQLRQIDERLSNRNTQRFMTQQDFNPPEHSPRHFKQADFKQKQIKTVRLSLTPPKHNQVKSRSKSPRIPKGSSRYRVEQDPGDSPQIGKWQRQIPSWR